MKDHLFCAAWSRKKEWIPKQQKYRQFPGLIDHIKQNWWFKERLSPQLSSGWGLLANSRCAKIVLLPSSIFCLSTRSRASQEYNHHKMYKICSWQEVLLFPKDQEQARTSISVSIATTRWRQSQQDICLVDWHLLLRMQGNKTQNHKQRERILRILSSKIPWWIWQKQNLINLMYPTKKQKTWLHLSSNLVKRVVFKLKIWRQLCPHCLKTLNPHFNQPIYQFPFLCSFIIEEKKLFWKKFWFCLLGLFICLRWA